MYKYIAILVGLLVLLMLFMWISNLLSGGKTYTYEQVENKMVSACKAYTNDNKGVLPSSPNTSTTVSVSTLVNGGYLDALSSYLNTDVNCSGSVEIYLASDGEYTYIPSLSCGNKYGTTKLSDKVIADNGYGTVTGSGLYLRLNGSFVYDEDSLVSFGSDDEFEYVFRGDEVNNFVAIDDNYYRIVAINSNNDMLLIYTGHIQKAVTWDDRYNDVVGKNQGINIYEQNGIKSRAMEAVESFYSGEAVLNNKEAYSDKTRYLTVPMNLCVGKRKETDTDISGQIECSLILENQNAGLLPAYYYMSASLDDNCKTISSKNCGNYNYLSQFEDNWWLLTANSEVTNESYMVSRKYAESALCSYKSYIRPTIMLSSRTVYDGGTGTEADPYIVKYSR